MDVKLRGRETYLKLRQLPKVQLSIYFMVSGIVISLKLLQPAKASAPIYVTLLRIAISAKLRHDIKAPCPILFTPVDTTTESNRSQP